MTEAKELDPAALEAATAQLQMYLHKGVSVERSIEIVGAAISTYLRSLPSNAPSLGEARLAEGEAVAWVSPEILAAMKRGEPVTSGWKRSDVFCIPLYAHPSHVQAEAGEAVVTTPPKISELANDLWEALFGIMRGAVPDDLTNEVLNQLAARMAVAYSISERAAP